MIAHISGQILNSSRLGESLGVSHTTLRSYVDLLTQTFMVRILLPYEANVKKRLIKSPKIYIRDSGILHALLDIRDANQLLGHPVFGSAWESFVIEQISSAFQDNWQISFYRTASGAEMDLVLNRGSEKYAVEIKASGTPKLTKGFWNALEDLSPRRAWVIAPVETAYPIHEKVFVSSLNDFLREFNEIQEEKRDHSD